MPYLPEVQTGQQYNIDGELFKITHIRATNVLAQKDYIIAVTFKNDNKVFDTNIENVIDNDVYQIEKMK